MNFRILIIALINLTTSYVFSQSGSTVYSVTKSNATQAGGGNAVNEKMCWMGSYGRGVGTIPNQCNSGMELRDGLCYKPCAQGYTGVGPVCWQSCPAGFRDDGAFCGKPAAYGRGGGYPWRFGDGFNDRGMFRRCHAAHGNGNCQKNGAIVYPRCRAGFHQVGCCICSPNCVDGQTDIGVSCAKKSYGRGAGVIPTGCSDGKTNQHGLCYVTCRTGYKGVGPVCWADNCPTKFPTKCGLGCAVNSTECGWAIFDQVSSVGEAIFNIATFGSGSAATTTARVGTQVAKTTAKTTAQATIKQQLKNKAREMGKELAESCAENAALMCYDAQLTGEFAWESLDPTGIANIVKAFNKPLCTDFF